MEPRSARRRRTMSRLTSTPILSPATEAEPAWRARHAARRPVAVPRDAAARHPGLHAPSSLALAWTLPALPVVPAAPLPVTRRAPNTAAGRKRCAARGPALPCPRARLDAPRAPKRGPGRRGRPWAGLDAPARAETEPRTPRKRCAPRLCDVLSSPLVRTARPPRSTGSPAVSLACASAASATRATGRQDRALARATRTRSRTPADRRAHQY